MMTQEESRKILLRNGIIFDNDMNISQFGDFKARSILQIMFGLVVGARCMNATGKIAKEPFVFKFLGNPVEGAQLGRDVRRFGKQEIETFL